MIFVQPASEVCCRPRSDRHLQWIDGVTAAGMPLPAVLGAVFLTTAKSSSADDEPQLVGTASPGVRAGEVPDRTEPGRTRRRDDFRQFF
ncbi:unnamed protein product [Amoebophrya sp. A120]|nr:unnamed protein product [Amoebophrya sp. A120]|eukprot:GSA120T00014453001.1